MNGGVTKPMKTTTLLKKFKKSEKHINESVVIIKSTSR